MSNVRFLDNVLVTSPVAASDAVGGAFPRVVLQVKLKQLQLTLIVMLLKYLT